MSRRRGTRGNTLMEVMAAMSLFSLVGSGTAALAVQSMRQTMQNRQGTAAAMLAQQRLEELRGLDYVNMVPYSTSQTVNGISYTVSHSVLENNPAAGMKTITATVSWNSPGGPKSYAVKTIYTSVTS